MISNSDKSNNNENTIYLSTEPNNFIKELKEVKQDILYLVPRVLEEIHKKFEESFINLFYLTKNNKDKNLDLKKYFILNYDYFSEKNKKIIIDNY